MVVFLFNFFLLLLSLYSLYKYIYILSVRLPAYFLFFKVKASNSKKKTTTKKLHRKIRIILFFLHVRNESLHKDFVTHENFSIRLDESFLFCLGPSSTPSPLPSLAISLTITHQYHFDCNLFYVRICSYIWHFGKCTTNGHSTADAKIPHTYL